MIYILDLLEFQVLAAARNMDSYYGFASEKEPAREEVYYTVYQMARSGILKQEQKELVIQPPYSEFLDEVARASSVLVIDRGGYVLPRQCIYFGGKGYVCLENCDTDQDRVSLCRMDEEEFFVQMTELEQLPSPHLKGEIGQYDFVGYWEAHIDKELRDRLSETGKENTEEYLEYGQVHSVFTMRQKETGQVSKRMILVELPLEYCMVLQKAGQPSSMEPYTREKAWEILKTWWRDER